MGRRTSDTGKSSGVDINIRLSSKITRFSYFCLFSECYFDIEMLVLCVDIGSSVGRSINTERSSTNTTCINKMHSERAKRSTRCDQSHKCYKV